MGEHGLALPSGECQAPRVDTREMLQSARSIVDTYLQAQVIDWQETLQ